MRFLAEPHASERETRDVLVAFAKPIATRPALLAALLVLASLSVPLLKGLQGSNGAGQRPGLVERQGGPLQLSTNHTLTKVPKTPSSARLAEDIEALVFPEIAEVQPKTHDQRHEGRAELTAPTSGPADRGDQPTSVAPKTTGSATTLRRASEVDAAPKPNGDVGWVEQEKGSTSKFKLNKQRDWQISSTGFDRVEDNKMTYASPDSGVRLTAREAASGFGANFATRSFGFNDYQTYGPLDVSPMDGRARSQKIDWKLFDSKNFGVTAFGYQSEVGRGFEPFGGSKKEFKEAGTRQLKAGANMRVGAFGFGLSQSTVEKTYGSSDAAFTSGASASVDLPRLAQAAKVPGDLTLKLIPTLWMNASTSQSPSTEQGDETVTMGFGGTWAWDMGYASLGYWSSSLGDNSGLGAAWSGQGFDANVGAYYGAFAVDVGMSYGQSEDSVPSWQSTGDVYNYSATVSYNGENLPGLSLTAAMGNYDQSSLSFGSAFSESYAWSSNSDYVSLSAGLDLTSMFWSSDGKEDQPSVKMLYRHNESVFSDSYSDTKDVDDLIAVTVQRKF